MMEPDLAFIRRLKTDGGDTFKQCFQCATCSVVCALAPEEHPFPRKEMLWAQRGLKDRLLSDPDIWLCHQCQDCSRHCPRGANPGDVLAGLRRLAIQEYAYPRPLARGFYDPRFLPLLFAIPVLILALVAGFMGTLRIPDGRIVFSKLFTYGMIDAIFLLTAFWTAFCVIVGGIKLWQSFRRGACLRNESIATFPHALQELPSTFRVILKHSWFQDCSVNRFRFFSHSNILWGFTLLFLTTTSL